MLRRSGDVWQLGSGGIRFRGTTGLGGIPCFPAVCRDELDPGGFVQQDKYRRGARLVFAQGNAWQDGN